MRLRRTKLLDRKVNVRDASLFVIATEGQETERQYFEGFRNPRVHVEVLPTGLDGRSSPEQVLARLAEFRDRYDFGPEDQLWVVVDVDRWGDRKLRDVCRDAQGRFDIAVSNPCFEFWLYLHVSENDLVGDPAWAALVAAHRNNPSAAMEARLRERLTDQGGYTKIHLNFERFRPLVPAAIERARALHDADPAGDRWPRTLPGTYVFRLAERLLLLPPTA